MDTISHLSPLGLLFGAVVGISLGLTGGGGAIFAVPLLVYGLAVRSHDAIGVSLITVGATALVGFVQRSRSRMVEFPTGLLFAVAGMVTAPLGAWLARRMPGTLLLTLFGGLMLLIALRMWFTAGRLPAVSSCSDADNAGPSCRRDPQGELRLTSRCAMVLAGVGMCTGVLTGLFGVGGGFMIVPALITFSGMGMQRAIGTSLLVTTLVSLSGIASFFSGGGNIPPGITVLFLVGSIGGLFAGAAVAKRLAGPRLQRIFAVAIVIVGLFIIFRNLAG